MTARLRRLRLALADRLTERPSLTDAAPAPPSRRRAVAATHRRRLARVVRSGAAGWAVVDRRQSDPDEVPRNGGRLKPGATRDARRDHPGRWHRHHLQLARRGRGVPRHAGRAQPRSDTGMTMSWHMTKGQRAMAVATIYPEPEKGGRRQKSFVTKGFSEGHLSKARTVLAASTSMATDVLAGTLSLATLGVHSRARAPYSAISGQEAAWTTRNAFIALHGRMGAPPSGHVDTTGTTTERMPISRLL